ncbi:MAG: NAD-dependent epimerase/dehydratase family protein [Patescibacteria group bacterium]
MKNVLVTGGAGFVGSYLVRALIKEGVQVRVVDDLSTGKRERLSGLPVEFIEASLFEREKWRPLLAGVDTIFHLAARTSAPESILNPLDTHAVNVSGTVVVLEEARTAAVQRVVYAGSAAVYGDEPSLPKREDSPIAPQSPYGLTKYMGEEYCRLYTQVFGLSTVILRYMNIVGAGQDPKSGYAAVIPIFVQKVRDGQPLSISGDGTQTRDFVSVDDVVRANILAARADGVSGETFNIGTGVETSLNDFVEALARASGTSSQVMYDPPRPGDIYRSVADVTKARERLGFVAEVPFNEAVRRAFNS